MLNFIEIECQSGEYTLYGYYADQSSEYTVVLIPGSYGSYRVWLPVLEHSGIKANILLAELPGFGKSRPKTMDGTIEQFAAQILEIINAAGIERFYIGGHSIGGMIAVEMLDHAAERLDGVIAIEGWTHYSVERDAFHGLKNQTLTEEQRALSSYYRQFSASHWTEDELREYSKIWTRWTKGEQLLMQTNVPVLEIWGDRGMKDRPSRSKLLIPDVPHIQLEWILNGGHSLTRQYPSLLGDMIAAYVDRDEVT